MYLTEVSTELWLQHLADVLVLHAFIRCLAVDFEMPSLTFHYAHSLLYTVEHVSAS